jgi:hypothetical protein
VMMVTIAPFAALAIAGMSFRGGADCAPATPDTRAIRRKRLITLRFTIVQFLSYRDIPQAKT